MLFLKDFKTEVLKDLYKKGQVESEMGTWIEFFSLV